MSTLVCGQVLVDSRERLLRPAWIARIGIVIERVAGSPSAIDEQCRLCSDRGQRALQRSHIIEEVLAVEARIAEHDDRACRARFFIEDRQRCVGRIGLEAVLALGPLLQKEVVANMADDAQDDLRKMLSPATRPATSTRHP
jgi:hypothetical protein